MDTNEPAFLDREELLAIHRDQLRRYGGFVGVRDEEALNTALAAPEARLKGRFINADLPAMAAAYLVQLTRHRPFVDGNKRTAVLAAMVFLALNGYPLQATAAELAELATEAAAGRLDRAAVAARLRAQSAAVASG